MKKVVITGPESTGKSTLAKALARHFNTEWTPEYAREYIGALNRGYVQEDIEIISKVQLVREQNQLLLAQEVLFCDTDLIVCKIWSEFVFGTCSQWILDRIHDHKYDLYLLMDIDLPWEDDPQREHPLQRKELFNLYVTELERLEQPYEIISGIGEERFNRAIEVIKNRSLIEKAI